MKRMVALAAGVFLSASLIASANEAPVGTSGGPQSPQGITNAKKSMKHRIEQDKKKDEVRKKGQAKRHQAQKGK